MIKALPPTCPDYGFAFLRTTAGIVIWPYGMQKLFGWFGGVGIKGTFEEMAVKKVPKFIAWLVTIGQSFGSTALIFGFLGRIAAGGLFIIFTGPDIPFAQWMDNELVWQKNGEGIEYHVLLLALPCHSIFG